MKARSNTRFRSDSLLMFVALFGIFGGIVVFRSFANPRFDTTKPGIIALKDIRNNSMINEFTFHISPGLQYCFRGDLPINYATADYSFTRDGSDVSSSIRQTTQVNSNTPICFSSDQDQPDVIIAINPTIAPLINSVEISRPN